MPPKKRPTPPERAAGRAAAAAAPPAKRRQAPAAQAGGIAAQPQMPAAIAVAPMPAGAGTPEAAVILDAVDGGELEAEDAHHTVTYDGVAGTRMARSSSIDSVDSDDEHYHMPGTEHHQELREAAPERSAGQTTNVLKAGLQIAYSTGDGQANTYAPFPQTWNSGYEQEFREEDEKPDFRTQLIEFTARHPKPDGGARTFSPQLHAHSEVAMAADPGLEDMIRAESSKVVAALPHDAKILKAVIRTHSSPNTVCTTGVCREALKDVQKRAEEIVKKLPLGEGQRLSRKFAAELAVTSDRPFSDLKGNKPHKAMAAGSPEGEAAPRGADESRVIEVLNDASRKKLEQKARKAPSPMEVDSGASESESEVESEEIEEVIK